jgi:hypothetical protein
MRASSSSYAAAVDGLDVEPAGALTITPTGTTPNGWRTFDVRGRRWGRARLTVRYADGTRQTIHYKVIAPAVEVVADLGRFLTTEQWFEDPDDPFGRSPSVISYDYDAKRPVTGTTVRGSRPGRRGGSGSGSRP